MTSQFGTLFTKLVEILVTRSTLKAYRYCKIHFGLETFAVTPSPVSRQIMKAQFMCKKMAYRPFFGLPIRKWAKNRVFDQNFNFQGQIAEKWEFSQIQTNIPWLGPKKYYNFGEFEKNGWTSFLWDIGNLFSQNWLKFTKSAPEPNESVNKIWKKWKFNWIIIETC